MPVTDPSKHVPRDNTDRILQTMLVRFIDLMYILLLRS